MNGKRNMGHRTMALVLVLVITLAASFTLAYAVKIEELDPGDEAVTTVGLNFRTGPGVLSKVQSVLAKNTAITVIERSNSWYKVSLKDGRTGYVYGQYLSKVEKEAAAAPVSQPEAAIPVSQPEAAIGKPEATMILATTTSTRDTGLLDVLVPAFDKKYGVSTKVVAVGTGEAIEMGKQGNADVLLVHARKSEDAFVDSGYGVNRKDVMYNYFFIVGPKEDPIGISSIKDAGAAMKKIADSKAKFVSRGDQSGTHKKELEIWNKYGLKPQGEAWYIEAGQGMGDTLMMASEMGGYTLVDSGTWYAFQDKVNMKVVLEGDPVLFNPYGVIAVNPQKYPNIHYNAAMTFVQFITSGEGQQMIGEYMKNGQKLFIPNATK
ncbi:MAG TPA: substrate-binding domain-containing protein [Clostridia bacterium]|nr:substrate-binding domain-containing protein [Clostridia bacterium]